ncbi:hypothetical protein TNCV_2207301 [Trichonephila clavipes]|uniref:Uncharacterized protein n=1 Tax=Trichonephila clavipes TaxID=2585209 RepID=A0A8X6VAD5_TRICX|nr:hypothetical protein TNCV_2207301 [Trichonephila clavipes]
MHPERCVNDASPSSDRSPDACPTNRALTSEKEIRYARHVKSVGAQTNSRWCGVEVKRGGAGPSHMWAAKNLNRRRVKHPGGYSQCQRDRSIDRPSIWIMRYGDVVDLTRRGHD